jgi:hypothetical protein
MIQPQQQPQPPVHDRNFASKIFGALADVLGGKTGSQVGSDGTVTHPDLSRTQQFSRILGNAMGGFSAGAQVHGPGAALGSIGAGFQAQQAAQQQQQQQLQTQQKEAFDQSQRTILTKATVAEANSRATANAFTAYHTGMEIDQGLQAQASIARQPFVDSDQPAVREHVSDSEIHDGMKMAALTQHPMRLLSTAPSPRLAQTARP